MHIVHNLPKQTNKQTLASVNVTDPITVHEQVPVYKRVDKRIFTNTADGHCSMDTRGGAGINEEWELLCNVTVYR